MYNVTKGSTHEVMIKQKSMNTRPVRAASSLLGNSVFARLAVSIPVLVATAAGMPVQADAPRVVATIKPIHALASSVMDGLGTPELLIRGLASPHGLKLKPSQARLLARAEVVIWIGPGLESDYERALKNLASKAVLVTLQAAEGVRIHKLREGGLWEAHDHHDHGHHDHGEKKHHQKKHGHDERRADVDAHIWLDPYNAITMARAIAGTLAKVDAPNAAVYRANAAKTIARLKALDAEIAQMLRPIRNKRYIVFHDAYQYFERRYRLAPVGSLTVDPHLAPPPSRLYDLRKRILERGAACVFREPQFEPKIVNILVRGTPAKVGILDPLGADLSPGKGAYAMLLRRLAAGLRSCLA